MKTTDPLERLQGLLPRLVGDVPPQVNVVPQVMRRIRTADADTDRALVFFALGSCLITAVVVVVGLTLLREQPDPLGAFFQIVPPIEF